jgi:lipopolysaccharide transport system permease protein
LNPLIKLFRNRELLLVWTWREIQVQYKQSVLGIAWAILQPLSLMLIFTVVFSVIVRVPTGDIPYPLFSYAAVLPWTYFATSITLGVPSLVVNLNLVTKVRMPREVFPLAVVLAGFVNYAVASLLFFGMLFFYQVQLNWTVIWVVPLLVIQILLSIAVVLAGSALNVLFRDIRFIVPLAVQLWMYVTPVIYPVDLVPEQIRTIYFLNPMAVVIDGYRDAILLGLVPNINYMALAFCISLSLLIIAFGLFKKLEPVFADII